MLTYKSDNLYINESLNPVKIVNSLDRIFLYLETYGRPHYNASMPDLETTTAARILRNKGYVKLQENLAKKGLTLKDHFSKLGKNSAKKKKLA